MSEVVGHDLLVVLGVLLAGVVLAWWLGGGGGSDFDNAV